MKTTATKWYRAQVQVSAWLRGYGIKTLRAGYFAPFDLYTPRGTRIEVKFSPLKHQAHNGSRSGKVARWSFNIQRHGKVTNTDVDFYVLVCQMNEQTKAIGLATPIYLVLPAPIKGNGVHISMRQLMMKWGQYANAIDVIKRFDQLRTEKNRAATFSRAEGSPNLGKTLTRSGGYGPGTYV